MLGCARFGRGRKHASATYVLALSIAWTLSPHAVFFKFSPSYFDLLFLWQLLVNRHVFGDAVGWRRGTGRQQGDAGRKQNGKKASFHHPVS